MTALNETRTTFWTNVYRWPGDTKTHIFLARAVHATGRAMFGEDWTGTEPQVEFVDVLPGLFCADVEPSTLKRGCELLHQFDEGYRQRCPIKYMYIMPTKEEWARAVQISEAENQRCIDALSRYYQVCDWLTWAFRADKIETATVPFQGGAEEPRSRTFWNCMQPYPRFYLCRVDPLSPFSPSQVVAGDWLYIERASFERFLEGLRRRQQPQSSGEELTDEPVYLSPYVRCLIQASKKLKVAPDRQPKKEEVRVVLRECWDGDQPLSNADLDKMATCVRDPESKLGRAKTKR